MKQTRICPNGFHSNKEENCDCGMKVSYNKEEVIEQMAAIEHDRWSKWQKYLHSKLVEHSDGKGEYVCLPMSLFNRWERQIATSYSELSEEEKESDRIEARKYMHILDAAFQAGRESMKKDIKERIEISKDDISYLDSNDNNECIHIFSSNLRALK